MINKILIKVLLRLDRLLGKFQNSLQNARVRLMELVWDLIENYQRKHNRSHLP
jgi:hypothetical protein